MYAGHVLSKVYPRFVILSSNAYLPRACNMSNSSSKNLDTCIHQHNVLPLPWVPSMVRVRGIDVHPPLLNTSCAWASDLQQLTALYDCPHTGAVSTRTATLSGFKEDSSHTVGRRVLVAANVSDLEVDLPGSISSWLVVVNQLIWVLTAPSVFLYNMGANAPRTGLPIFETLHYQHHGV